MKRKFRADEKAIITANLSAEEEERRRRGMITQPLTPDYLARRAVNEPAIIFYDLGQVNTGTVDTPIWSDHPILKTPTYSVALGGGVDYSIEEFDDSDYQAFTDSLFAIGAVAEWKNLFRKMTLNPLQTTFPYQESFPINLSIKSTITNSLHSFTALQRVEDITTPTGKAQRLSNLSTYGFCWDLRGLEYTTLDRIHVSSYLAGNPLSPGNTNFDFFTFDTTDSLRYKVTATYDPNDTDVMSTLTFSGAIDVYLIPQPCLYFAVGALASDYDPAAGFNVIFAYQVLPRQYYPDYADPFSLLSNDARNANFFSYQQNRLGMVGSNWTYSGGTLTETTLDPTTFLSTVNNYTGMVTNSNITRYSHPSVPLSTRSISATGTKFDRTSDQLIAVFKIRGQFYYVWSNLGGSVAFYADNTNAYILRSTGYPGT